MSDYAEGRDHVKRGGGQRRVSAEALNAVPDWVLARAWLYRELAPQRSA